MYLEEESIMRSLTAMLATIALGVMVAAGPATVSMARGGGHGGGHGGFGGHGLGGHGGFGSHGFSGHGFRGGAHPFGGMFRGTHGINHFGINHFGDHFRGRHLRGFRRFGHNDRFWGPFYYCEFPGLYRHTYPYAYCP